jgi:large subunit ribosomal protein L4
MSELTVNVLTADGEASGSVELPAALFDVQANMPLMHQVVVAQLAAARQGTHATKTRAQVSGGGAKPYRQKGTGRARQGSTRAPQFAGGGIVHGPQPRSYAQRTPKKMKAAALRGALSDRARDGRVHVVESLVSGQTPSTKAALKILNTVTSAKHSLVVLERGDELTLKSLRNVPTVHLLFVDQLNTYDVLVNEDVVFTAVALTTYVGGDLELAPAKPSTTKADAKTDAKADADEKPAKAPKKKAAKADAAQEDGK